MKKLLLLLFLFSNTMLFAQDTIYKTLLPLQCDSVIQANQSNPNFLIMDVRRPSEYIPQHLEGAINRNYYDFDFDEQLDSLDHKKTYLIYCHSGSRSGKTFTKMINKKFREVYNMQGGITAWKYASLPVTDTFAPKLMLASDNILEEKTIDIGTIDTINITVTNRANDTLKYISSTSLDGTEYSTDFDIAHTQLGAEDYSFNIFYQPEDESTDSLTFILKSNGGNIKILISRKGRNTTKTGDTFAKNIKIYPNPVVSLLKIELPNNTFSKIQILDISGKKVYSSYFTGQNKNIDMSRFENGFYYVKIFNSQFSITKKIIVSP
ncbi:MAG TPA: T9SS type A sorting domain-containing protein [Bacteroidetes bacterium]|nr:T9SS type A sorting domain-containing protein [Arcobacter sp.]HHH52102.1 T9SS type A sorting domain-containing protein [Bacteroidota bacterium]